MSSYTSTSTLTDRGQFYELTLQFRQQHFLVGLVLSDLKVALDTQWAALKHTVVKKKAYWNEIYVEPHKKIEYFEKLTFFNLRMF